jgi:opacity protein-like surface antigen
MRNSFSRGLLLVPIFAVLIAAPASAQRWKWDLGVYGGYGWFTSMLDEEDTNLPDDAAGAEVHFDAGWLAGLQFTYNVRPNLGVRLNTRYSDRPVQGSDMDPNFVTSTNLWAASLDLLFRFGQPREEFAGMEILPYLAAGLGVKWINPAYDDFECAVAGETESCLPFTTGGPPGSANSRTWALDESKGIMGLIGLGADWRLGRSFSLRTEINDQIYKPKIWRGTFVAGGGGDVTVADEENQSSMIHELAFTVGLHFLMGLEAPPVVVVAPPPPPPPVTPPPPPPAPVEEAITVCVIDPTAPGGIRMQAATLVERRDTFVVVGGTRTPIAQAVGTVTVANGADWYVRGQPLVMTVGRTPVQFTTYGSTQVISDQDVVFIGTVNGFPVYADRDDVADVINELNELNRTRPGTDLGVLLNDQRALRTNLEDVRMFYVPVYPYGCVFQGVQRQEAVIKGGK